MAWQAAAGVVVARSGLTRLREQASPAGRAARRRNAYQADARFLTGLGLDPARVLGPPPEATGASR